MLNEHSYFMQFINVNLLPNLLFLEFYFIIEAFYSVVESPIHSQIHLKCHFIHQMYSTTRYFAVTQYCVHSSFCLEGVGGRQPLNYYTTKRNIAHVIRSTSCIIDSTLLFNNRNIRESFKLILNIACKSIKLSNGTIWIADVLLTMFIQYENKQLTVLIA